MLFSELKPIYCADCDAPLRKGEGHTQRDKRIVCDKCQTRIERKREGARQRDLFVEQSSLFNPVITRRRNIEGYTDETGFHPIRASKDYNEFLAGDFEPRERKLTKKQQRELDEWHKREEEQVREDMLLSGIPKKTLAQYVRAIGGIVPGGAYAGEIRRLSYKETGTTGLINQKARQGALKQSAEFVMDSANEEGYRDRNGERFTSIGDFLSAVEESAVKGIDHFRARGMTAKQSRDKRLKKAMAHNPKKRKGFNDGHFWVYARVKKSVRNANHEPFLVADGYFGTKVRALVEAKKTYREVYDPRYLPDLEWVISDRPLRNRNPHSSFHALSAARSRKAARVEAKGRAIVSAGAKRQDAALMQKGARLAKRGLSSGEGHTLKGGTHTEGPVGRLPNPKSPLDDYQKKHLEDWLNNSYGGTSAQRRRAAALIKRYVSYYPETVDPNQVHWNRSWREILDLAELEYGRDNPGFLSRVRGNLKREKIARKLAGVQGRIKAATDSLREYDTDSIWDDVPKAKKRGKAKAKAHLDDLKQLEKELIADFRAVKNPAMKGEYVVEWWKWPNKKPAGAKYFTNIGEALDFADKKQDSADPVIVYRWSSDRWVRVAGAQPPGWTGIDPQYRKNPGNDSVHIDAGHVTVVGKAKRMSTQNPGRKNPGVYRVETFNTTDPNATWQFVKERHGKTAEFVTYDAALKLARKIQKNHQQYDIRIFPYRGAGTVKEIKAKRKNPGVNEIAKEFQGKASGAVVEQYAASSAPKNLARAGRLVFLKLAKGHTMRIPGAMVAIGPNKRLWITGDHAPLFTTKAKRGEGLDLGEVAAICYETAKKHIGDGKRFEYVHKFGEDGGRRPRLVVDSEGMPILRGGDYQVKAEGIVN